MYGCLVSLLPVAAYIALATAAPTGGKVGSPKPVGAILFSTKWISTSGVSPIRINW